MIKVASALLALAATARAECYYVADGSASIDDAEGTPTSCSFGGASEAFPVNMPGDLDFHMADAKSAFAGVRCCDDMGGGMTPKCQNEGDMYCASRCETLDYYTAKSYCEHYGQRLCTRFELLSDQAAGTGLGYDTMAVWTSEQCDEHDICHFIVDGHPLQENGQNKCSEARVVYDETTQVAKRNEAVAGVRCCSLADDPYDESDFTANDDTLVSIGIGTNVSPCNERCEQVTFYEAHARCEAQGRRLCTVDELEVEHYKTQGTGCNYDHMAIWSATEAACHAIGPFGSEGNGLEPGMPEKPALYAPPGRPDLDDLYNWDREIWNGAKTNGDFFPGARGECGAAEYDGKFLIFGGRSSDNTLDTGSYDPSIKFWNETAIAPIEISHFQAQVFKDLVYVIGAQTDTPSYPFEPGVDKVLAYSPVDDVWYGNVTPIPGFDTPHYIPPDRVRSSAGTAVYNGLIWIMGGTTVGHNNGSVAWLDTYDPLTGAWNSSYPDAPNIRDHHVCVVLADKLYVIGGRLTSQGTSCPGQPNIVDQSDTIAATDVYDFKTGTWSTVANLNRGVAGLAAFPFYGKIVVTAGEYCTVKAQKDTEVFDPLTSTWTRLNGVQLGRQRHGSGYAFMPGITESYYIGSTLIHSGCGWVGAGNREIGDRLPLASGNSFYLEKFCFNP